MLNLYEHSVDIEIAGETYPAEIQYELDLDDGFPIIHNVTVLKQTCKTGEVWYGHDGSLQFGPHWVRLDITDLLSPQQIGNFAYQICEFRKQVWHEEMLERASDRAIEQYLQYRESGYFNNPMHSPMHFTGVPV